MFGFAVVGAGWRTEFFLNVANELECMRVCGVVARNAARAAEIEARWNVPCFSTAADLMAAVDPSYVIACVSADAMPEVCLELAGQRVPILLETPPAPTLASLVNLYEQTPGARIQVAEQYWAQPLHSARQHIVDSGLLGVANQVNVSVCHGYHAMSLIRRLLGVKGDTATIRGQQFRSRVIAGPDRCGPPTRERVDEVDTDIASIDFGDRLGIYEFCLPQYRSWIRGQRVCVRGERGEIIDDRVTYLKDYHTPVTAHLVRHEAGRNGNLEGYYLKSIQYLEDRVYENAFAPARFSDEEIAVATVLTAMQDYVETGRTFYSLADACEDQYLALACAQAIETGETITTERQPWSDQI